MILRDTDSNGLPVILPEPGARLRGLREPAPVGFTDQTRAVGTVSRPAPAFDPLDENAALPAIWLHGVRLHRITERQCIDHIIAQLADGRGGVVVTPNLDHLRRCRRDVSFAALVAEADLVVADGMPLVWASRLQGTSLPQRVAGSDLISTLTAAAAENGRSIFLLGGDVGTAAAAGELLTQRCPGLTVAGAWYPPLGFEQNEREMSAIESALIRAKPDIVYVALGSPKQERLIARLRSLLPCAWWLGVGVSFSFLTGDVQRAPMWMRKTGLEWIHRLLQEPRRLFRRYIIDGLPFASRLLAGAAIKGLAQRLGWINLIETGSDPKSDEPPQAIADDTNIVRQDPSAGLTERPASARRAIDRLSVEMPAAREPGPVRGSLSLDENAMSQEMSNLQIHSNPAGNDAISASVDLSPAHMPPIEGMSRLRGLLLMAGSVRPSRLATSLGRSLLDLPIDNQRTVLTHWLEQAAHVARLAGLENLPVRVLIDRNAVEPRSGQEFNGAFTVERDLSDYRGTGGLLAGVAVDYDDDDLILVSNAAQLLLEPLSQIAAGLHKMGGVVNLISHRDGTPSGMMLLTCRALRLIPTVGFVDMKEQALPMIAAKYDVRVLHCARPTGLPVRSLSDYVTALRVHHRPRGAPLSMADPLAEDWRPTFMLAETGANIAPSARVHDSVVLAGGVVEAGAVVVRSVIGPDGIVRKDRKVADQVVAGPENK